MKFVISSSELLARLQLVSRVLPAKSTIPMTQMVLFELHDTDLTLTATDSDLTIITTMPVFEGYDDGRFAIKPDTLIEGLREMGEQPITLELNPETYEVSLRYLNGYNCLVGCNADAFPKPNVMQGDYRQVAGSAAAVLTGVSRALFAAGDDISRPIMNGVYFDMQPEGTAFVASDGHKLVRNFSDELRISEPAAFVLLKRPAKLLKEMLAKQEGDLDIRFGDRALEFRLPNYTLLCLQPEGHFPNYQSVIPENNPYHVTIDRESFVSALRRVVIFASDATGLLRLQITSTDVTISTQNDDYSMVAEEHVLCDYNGTPMTIGFKGLFLIDILSTIPSRDVVMQLADPSRAGVIVPAEQEEHCNLLMLIMPMMINN